MIVLKSSAPMTVLLTSLESAILSGRQPIVACFFKLFVSVTTLCLLSILAIEDCESSNINYLWSTVVTIDLSFKYVLILKFSLVAYLVDGSG